MRRIKIIVLGTAILAIAGLVASYFFLGSIIKVGITTVGPELTKASVEVGSVILSPFTGKARIRGLKVGNPMGFTSESAIRLNEFRIQLVPSSLATNVIHIKSVLIERPEITKEGSDLNVIQRNVESFAPSESKPSNKDSPAKKVIIDDLWVKKAKVHVELLGNMTTFIIPDIHLTDIGKDTGGATPAQAIDRVMRSILSGVSTGVADASKNLSKEAGKLGKGLKKLFKKM